MGSHTRPKIRYQDWGLPQVQEGKGGFLSYVLSFGLFSLQQGVIYNQTHHLNNWPAGRLLRDSPFVLVSVDDLPAPGRRSNSPRPGF